MAAVVRGIRKPKQHRRTPQVRLDLFLIKGQAQRYGASSPGRSLRVREHRLRAGKGLQYQPLGRCQHLKAAGIQFRLSSLTPAEVGRGIRAIETTCATADGRCLASAYLFAPLRST